MNDHDSTLPLVLDAFSESAFEKHAFNLWNAHLVWLSRLGWDAALKCTTAPVVLPKTGHEVVDLLARFVHQTGLVNAHTGLTSSDIVDNVRLLQLNAGIAAVMRGVRAFIVELQERDWSKYGTTVGFTHWQVAAPIQWSFRVSAWVAPLNEAVMCAPHMYAKQFGGPVGDAAWLELLSDSVGLEGYDFDFGPLGLHNPKNRFPIQSSDHTCELAAIAWVCAVAAQLHKIAADLRFLASTGIVVPAAGELAGSSSMPHKVNPFKWEKVCGVCRSISTTQQEMWDVAAHNSLERTLDTSWQLKRLLERAFCGLALALDTMRGVHILVNEPCQRELLKRHADELASDRDLMRRILAGEDRWSAFCHALVLRNHPTARVEPGERVFITKPGRARLGYDRVGQILRVFKRNTYRVQPLDCELPQTFHVKYLKRQL